MLKTVIFFLIVALVFSPLANIAKRKIRNPYLAFAAYFVIGLVLIYVLNAIATAIGYPVLDD